ncbi:ECF-type riboflavin transporter substrate-binding protein [Amphibacillus sp. MSJ-3]|uniref:ECF-type riboflavin transporter substrate-binding protein n=1 Tax=Amphibacillus sp. MSJ-3 TaxID=2841505 RepID=UPI001C0F1D72|nr:ECF-type riboflavin transporter substrate-binding protein [Amphibacillus sp. MSJ-3]MBU5594535.1 ECF-type riboflavin transporter substrate-binding protein [Amphibacillus sp. MSJ-3]
MKKSLSIKTIVAIGIGSAVYVILGRFLTIPTGIPNTNIETAIAFLAFIAVLFGPIAGGLIGLIGHALKDILMWGSIWWSWVFVSLFIGFAIGFYAYKVKLEDGVFGKKEIISFNLVQIIVQIIGWGVLAPTLDISIYAEPANKVFTQGLVAALTNIISVGVISTILLISYAKTQSKGSSLTKED